MFCRLMIQNYLVLAFVSCYVSNAARCNKWAFNNFESWRSEVAVDSLAEPDRIVGNGLGNLLKAFCSSTHQISGGDECLLIAYVYRHCESPWQSRGYC